MNLACKIVAGFLLLFILSTQGAAPDNDGIFWGTLGQDINLDIPGFQTNDSMDDIQWEKGQKRVARFQTGNKPKSQDERYQVSANGTLKIKQLTMEDSETYKVVMYNKQGKNALEKTFQLKIQEKVSKPEINWNCTTKMLSCEVSNGTDLELQLYFNETRAKTVHLKNITLKLPTKWKTLMTCTAENKVSKESAVKTNSCSEKHLDIYFIIGICGGGTIFVIFMALLIFYINKRKQQNRRRNGEELEIRTCRVTTKERGPKSCQVPGSAPQSPAASGPPPPPSHRPQAPGHRLPPPGHRAQHNQQRKAPPPPATQAYQQKGPPLPRPRVQPKPPRAATGSS
ncbi:T-cell surface antigen CD2 [Suricata suricatta]|uniref:CD2 molecule n=1 Tax=Suricata suricatta TaxID=37032 RepID=A0A673UKJ1_SURSU|nr:T-cell surface antigen CD2 [Suricata suricatta]